MRLGKTQHRFDEILPVRAVDPSGTQDHVLRQCVGNRSVARFLAGAIDPERRNRIVFETREVSQGKETAVTYHALIDPGLSLDDLSAQLMAGGTAGVQSVSWEQPKKGF